MKMRTRDRIIAAIVIIVLALLVLFFCQIAYFLFPSHADRTGELVKLVVTIIGGGCVIYGLFISNRRAKATEASVEIQGSQIELAHKSQIDERFKNAIEHLGSDNEPIILGGIAELHQIAKENSSKYAEVVFNILCSYIRTETSIYKKTANEINATVVDTIITYIFSKAPDNPYKGLSADLKSSNLGNQNLSNCDFTNANLSFCYLGTIEHSILDDANLSSANIYAQSLKYNHFQRVQTSNTKLVGATLINTSFFDAPEPHRFNVRCLYCKFEFVHFDNLNLYGSIFIGCTFYKCTFSNAAITKAYFYGCQFSDISFSNVNALYNTDFSASTFNNVDMSRIDVKELIFKGCSIERNFWPWNNIITAQLEEQKDKILNPDSLGISAYNAQNCAFEQLSFQDCESIIKRYNEIDSVPEFPLGKGKK